MNRIEEILTKLRIEFVQRGERLWALCPYHEDNHPSWFIRMSGARAGQHHCFTCHHGGTLVDLVMRRRDYINVSSAIEWLSEFQEAPPPPVKHVTFQVQSPIKKRFRLPREVRIEPLESWPAVPRRYLQARQVTPQQVERWRIGYAAEGRLSGRIVIPVFTQQEDQLVPWSYQARTFVDHEIRYFFPFQSDAPNLDVMWGALHWPAPAIRRNARIYVTEGSFNALAIERVIAPSEFVGALGSSDVRSAHLSQLATFGEVVIVTDNDKSGNAAAESLHYALARHTGTLRAKFPEGQDPDSVSDEERRCVLRMCEKPP